jgi:tagatose 1,6-diphosphate aldolase
MKKISIGKLRGLQQCASRRGTFTCLALDHRQNLRRSLFPKNPDSAPFEDIRNFKLKVASILATEATAVLLDPEYAAAQGVAQSAVPGQIGLVVAVEATGYTGDPTARESRILEGWSVEKAKRMGASAIKLLVYYHPDSTTAKEIEDFTHQVAEECQRYDLALMLEPLSYSLEGQKPLSSDEKRYVVVETARRLTPLGIDLLKAEFPLAKENTNEEDWEEACAELSATAKTPWILLSAAVDFDIFLRQVTAACHQGASGVAVGRAVWKEAVNYAGEEQAAFLRQVASERLKRLTSLCTALAKPMTDFYAAQAKADWYQTY